MLKWYLEDGNQNEIIISSRIRLARNLTDFPFVSKITPQQQSALCTKVKNSLENLNLGDNRLNFIEPEKLPDYKLAALVENHVISPDFANDPKNKLLVLSQSNDISIMVSEEDHLRIQTLKNGFDLPGALGLADMIDNVLDSSLSYAYSEKLGFLTACPTNLGTGLRASVMLHLPALSAGGYINRLSSTISKFGLTIRGIYGEGSRAKGNIYQISNQITLGITEKEAIENLSNIVSQIVKQEESARKSVFSDKDKLNDSILRSVGAMKYAVLMTSDEAMNHISNLRLGICLGIISDIPLKAVNELMSAAGSGSICSAAGQLLSPELRDKKRSEEIKRILNARNN